MREMLIFVSCQTNDEMIATDEFTTSKALLQILQRILVYFFVTLFRFTPFYPKVMPLLPNNFRTTRGH